MKRLAVLLKNIALSNISELKMPYRMTYMLTYRCQFSCAMCGIWRKDPDEEMSLREIENFFKKSGGLSWINLSGGEIFLRPDLPGILRTIDKHCKNLYLLNFPTNGWLTETIESTVKEALDACAFPKLMITVSLDGPPALHDSIRNMPGSWEKAVETYRRLRLLKSRRFDVYFGMTLQDANAEAFEESVEAVRKKIGNTSSNDFHVNVAHTSEHYYGNAKMDVLTKKEDVIRAVSRIKELRGRGINPVRFIERRYQSMSLDYLRSGKTPLPCEALGASFFMDPSGTVYPCSGFDRPVGNIRDFGCSLKKLWDSDERVLSREKIIKGKCPGCWTPCEAYQSIMANLLKRASG